MIKHILLLLAISTSAIASDETGRICFGKNLAKPYVEHTERLYLRINNSEIIHFNNTQEVRSLHNLDPNKDHRVEVFFDNPFRSSWSFNFSDLNTHSVIIWRSAGSWQVDPVVASRCR